MAEEIATLQVELARAAAHIRAEVGLSLREDAVLTRALTHTGAHALTHTSERAGAAARLKAGSRRGRSAAGHADEDFTSTHAAASPQPTRKSPRVAAQPRVNYQEVPIVLPSESAHTPAIDPGRNGGDGVEADAAEHRAAAAARRPSLPAEAAAGSLRTLVARVADMRSEFLGRHVPMALGGPGAQAKRAVMNAAAGPGVCPKFSRMSGIQQWKNAVFLFVNIASDGANTFRSDGRQITWFAQPTQTEVSPVIQRLIHHRTGVSFPPPSHAQPEQASGDADAEEPLANQTTFLEPAHVCLVCRIEASPYVWCGELEYVRHDAGSRPLRFVWSLRDADLLLASERRAAFQELLDTAPSAPEL